MTESAPSLREAQSSPELKKNLLMQIWEQKGDAAILEIGQSVTEIDYDPVWRIALTAPSAERLVEGWCRFEEYAHSSNRVAFKWIGSNSLSCKRHSLSAQSPTQVENLLICGLLIALLSGAGCENLECTARDEKGDFITIWKDGQFQNRQSERSILADQFKFNWSAFKDSKRYPFTDPDNIANIKMQNPVFASPWVSKICSHIYRDISRPWKLSDLAGLMNMSTRSLQRRLTENGLSFSSVIRTTRINMACQLLHSHLLDITAVGYCTGFTDSAHFSRDFKASMGMTPSEFKKALSIQKP